MKMNFKANLDVEFEVKPKKGSRRKKKKTILGLCDLNCLF